MGKKYKFLLPVLIIIAGVLVVVSFFQSSSITMLEPKGVIAQQQRDLIITAVLLMLIVVIPVFILTFFIAWKYRASNTKATYAPDWDHNTTLETIWWGIPLAIIAALGVITWTSSHALDPFKPIASHKKPVTIQVVALQWKWLFIYPDQKIATVNYVKFPVDTPVNFEVTGDAPMNSFWLPSLGGQIYAMAGMTTKLHLQANEIGSFEGSSANISGAGFSGMRFVAQSSSEQDFYRWVQSVRQSQHSLGSNEYDELAKPSVDNIAADFNSVDENLYDTIIMKYMEPSASGVKEGVHGH